MRSRSPKISTSVYVVPCHDVPVWKIWKHAVSDIRYLGTNLDHTAAHIGTLLHFWTARYASQHRGRHGRRHDTFLSSNSIMTRTAKRVD